MTWTTTMTVIMMTMITAVAVAAATAQLIAGQDTAPAGLTLIRVASEEFAAARGVSSRRGAYLRQRLCEDMNKVLRVLTSVLEDVYRAASQPAKADTAGHGFPPSTPCPSPTGV